MKWTGAAVLFGSVAATAPAMTNAASAKKNLIIATSELVGGWCSQDAPGVDQIAMKNLVLETLTMNNDKGVIVPYLAESVKAADSTNKVWNIKVRSGIKFSDGSDLNAAAVVANFYAWSGLSLLVWKSGQKPSLPAAAFLDLFGVRFDDFVAQLTIATTAADAAAAAQKKGDLAEAQKQGAAALKAQGELTKMVGKVTQNVVATDSMTVKVTLDTPRPNFPYLLWSNGRPAVMSVASLKSNDCGSTPAATIGTGPFIVKTKPEKSSQSDTLLEANPSYWRSTATNKLPKVDTVTAKIFTNSLTKANSVLTGKSDIATFGVLEGTQLARLSQRNVKLFRGKFDTVWSVHLNAVSNTGSPFDNINARKAFAHAIDRATIVRALSKNQARVADVIAPTMHPWHQPGHTLSFNLAKAKDFVKKYKNETGKDMEVVMPQTTSSTSGDLAKLMCQQLRRAGAKCTVSPAVTNSEYIVRAFDKKQHLAVFNVSAGNYADFGALFVTDTYLELSGFRFTEPALAKCFADARATATVGAAAKTAYKQCAVDIQEKVYMTPLYQENGALAYGNNVKGLGATDLPDGSKRPLLGLSGFDVAYVTK